MSNGVKTGKIIFMATSILIAAFSSSLAQGQPQAKQKLIVFFSPGCQRCVETKKKVMPYIEKEFKGLIETEYRDIDNIDNYKYLLSLKEKYHSDIRIDLPIFFFGGKFLNGDTEIKDNLRNLITKSLFGVYKEEAKLPKVDLIAHFKSFTPIAIISAGLIDGINPCAFTVIVFFISFLALQGYRKRELLVIGLCFIFAVSLTYIMIGLGLFGFLYRMENFWLITKILNYSIGIFSVALGIFCIHDFIEFKKTNKTEGLALQLPTAVKNQIHNVIGMHYRKTKDGQEVLERHIFRLTVSALVTGFLVSILEAVCTGQTYLPTISFILKTTHLKLQAFVYLLLYNLMFIVPLLMIFLFALLGVTSEQFSSFLKKHMLTIKVLMAILFFGLGIFLIWKA